MVDIVKALGQEPEPSLKKKSKAAGVLQPQQPNIAASMGATQKQAEMAASPQAQAAAQRDAQKAQREAQVQSQQAREVPKAGDSISRAQSLINNLSGYTENYGNIQDTALGSERVTPGERLSVNEVTQSPDILEGEDIDVQGGTEEALVEGASDALNITISELEELDPDTYNEVIQFANEYGLDPNTATLEDIRQVAQRETDAITADVDNNRAALNDPNLPSAQRKIALQNMKDLGAAHLIATDAELDKLEAELNSADKVIIEGQETTVNDIMSSPEYASVAYDLAEALVGGEDIDFETAKEKYGFPDSEGLFNFVVNNGPAIISSLEANQEAINQGREIVKKNKEALANIPEGVRDRFGITPYMSQDVYKMVPALSVFNDGFMFEDKSINVEQAREALNYFSNVDPDLVQRIMRDPNFERHMPALIQRTNRLQSLDNSKNVFQGLLAGTGLDDFGQLNKLLQDFKMNPDQYRDANARKLFKMLDQDGDGRLDSQVGIIGTLKEFYSDTRNRPVNLGGMQTYGQKAVSRYGSAIGAAGIDSTLPPSRVQELLIDNPSMVKEQKGKLRVILNRMKKDLDSGRSIPGLEKKYKEAVRYYNALKSTEKAHDVKMGRQEYQALWANSNQAFTSQFNKELGQFTQDDFFRTARDPAARENFFRIIDKQIQDTQAQYKKYPMSEDLRKHLNNLRIQRKKVNDLRDRETETMQTYSGTPLYTNNPDKEQKV